MSFLGFGSFGHVSLAVALAEAFGTLDRFYAAVWKRLESKFPQDASDPIRSEASCRFRLQEPDGLETGSGHILLGDWEVLQLPVRCGFRALHLDPRPAFVTRERMPDPWEGARVLSIPWKDLRRTPEGLETREGLRLLLKGDDLSWLHTHLPPELGL